MALGKMAPDEFARRLKAVTDETDKRFAFFVGAGCSVSSGIPDAATLVRERWLPLLRDMRAPGRTDLHAWTREQFPRYRRLDPAVHYGTVMEALFPFPEDRRHELEALCRPCFPGFGYAVVAGLMALKGGCFNVALTTNFDDLIADAAYVFTQARPLVIPHESLAAYIHPTHTRPLVVKLHGDHRLSPQNTTQETAKLRQGIESGVRSLLHDRGLIFVGYGGRDHSILRMLRRLTREDLPLGVYWVSPSRPPAKLRSWLEARRAIHVEIRDFDETMILVKDVFGLPNPDRKRFERVFQRYFDTYASASGRVDSVPDTRPEAPTLKEAAKRIEGSLPDEWALVVEATRAKQGGASAAQQVYERGLEQFPRSTLLLNSYGLLLSRELKDYDKAEEMYRRALGVDPDHAAALGNYAMLLQYVRMDNVGAEDMFRRAMAAAPDNAINLSNYAVFLKNVRKDYVRAEELFHHAVDADPNNANVLGNYAGFLLARGKREEGVSLLDRVLSMAGLIAMSDLVLECWFYAFAHRPFERRPEALSNLKRLLVGGARSPGWDLSENVERSRQDGHPDADWLEKLAQVISEEADISILDEWNKWQNA